MNVLPAEKIASLLRAYVQPGMSLAQASKDSGVARETAGKLLERAGRELRRRWADMPTTVGDVVHRLHVTIAGGNAADPGNCRVELPGFPTIGCDTIDEVEALIARYGKEHPAETGVERKAVHKALADADATAGYQDLHPLFHDVSQLRRELVDWRANGASIVRRIFEVQGVLDVACRDIDAMLDIAYSPHGEDLAAPPFPVSDEDASYARVRRIADLAAQLSAQERAEMLATLERRPPPQA